MKIFIGRQNVAVAWWMIGLSLLGGAVLGLWSFYPLLPTPAMFQNYDSVPRRLIRLAHIAAVALPVLNILYVRCLSEIGSTPQQKSSACRRLLWGSVLLPVVLIVAAFWQPVFYVLPGPVVLITWSIWGLAIGFVKGSRIERGLS